MIVTYTAPYFTWHGAFEERYIPRDAGFEWIDGAWRTRTAAVAETLLPLFDSSALRRRIEIKAQVEVSYCADAVLDVPHPEGLEYLPFQKAGIAYMLQRPAVLCGDEMGIGKTIQTIGVINSDESLKRILIVCPASLKLNWYAELKKWLTRQLTVSIGGNGDIRIVNYDILHRYNWKHEKLDLLVLDEVHYCKNIRSRRAQTALMIPARKRIFLSGTPITNRPYEFYPILRTLDKDAWHGAHDFGMRYCGGYREPGGTFNYSGASHLEELNERLRSTLMIRRLKKDVLTELPPKRRQLIELSGALPQSEQDFIAQVHRLKSPQTVFESIAKVRHEDALAKLPQCIDYIRQALESSEKIVVFAHHRDVIAALAANLPQSVVVTGDTPIQRRQEYVAEFQNNPECRLFIGNIQAAGVGITLTAASHVIFVELDWVPGVMTQAEDRCHRIGQRDYVLVQHLVLSGSIDAKIAKVLVAKQAVLDAALDGTELKPLDVMEAMLTTV